jgi:hypothetical protein
MGRTCSTGVVWKATKKETTRRHRRRWEDNIKMDRRETRWGGMDLIYLIRIATS